jgi:flagellar protein FlbD
MIFLSRLDGTELVVNADHILTVERTPDTLITLTSGARLMVREAVELLVERVLEYRRQVLRGPQVVAPPSAEAREG